MTASQSEQNNQENIQSGSGQTYPSQCVFALYRIVQPNDSHILFTCNKHRVVRGLLGFSVLTYHMETFLSLQKQEVVTVPALCWDLTNRVARSKQTIRNPVTFGSSVPVPIGSS